MEKLDNQEELMDWEKQMVKEVTKRVTDEINRKKNSLLSRPRVIISDLSYELECKKRIKEEIAKYREQYTLGLLAKCGLDMNVFMNSSLFTSPRTRLMLEHIQGLIDGYDLSLTSYRKENGSFSLNVRERKPNGHPIDISKMSCRFANGILVIEYNGTRYEYNKDKHFLIYLNGDVILTDAKVMTLEEANEAIKDLMDDMHADRLQRERREQNAIQYAKTWRVEE